MSSSRSSKNRRANIESDQELFSPQSLGRRSRKRSMSLQSEPSFDSNTVRDANSETLRPKRLKPGPQESLKNDSLILRNLSRNFSFDDSDGDGDNNLHADTQDDFLVVEEPSSVVESIRRRPSEKSLYMSPEKAKGPTKVVKQRDQEVKMSWPVKDLPSIKKEQVDTNEALRSPFSGKTSKSTDPIVVSSEESNLPSGIVEKPRPSGKSRCADDGRSRKNVVFRSAESDEEPHLSKGKLRDDSSEASPYRESQRAGGDHKKHADVPPPSTVNANSTRVKSSVDASQASVSLSKNTVYLEDLVPTVEKTSFTLVPFDSANGPSGCPSHLLHTADDGSTSPVELVAQAFDLFEGAAFQLITSAVRFTEVRPFVNVTTVSKDKVYAERYRNHVMWQGQNRSVLFTMLGSVQSCHLVEATTIGQHLYKAITIIPFGDAWRKFQIFLRKLYGQGQMRGPFEFGCVLTLSSRCEGYSTPDVSAMFSPKSPKKNQRAFGGSGIASSCEWLDSKLPNCIDFDKPFPIYDASQKPFLFRREDFVGMPSLPVYKVNGNISDLPVDSLVSVFFAMSSYSGKKASQVVPSAPLINDILSLNIHFVIYYGTIPA